MRQRMAVHDGSGEAQHVHRHRSNRLSHHFISTRFIGGRNWQDLRCPHNAPLALSIVHYLIARLPVDSTGAVARFYASVCFF